MESRPSPPAMNIANAERPGQPLVSGAHERQREGSAAVEAKSSLWRLVIAETALQVTAHELATPLTALAMNAQALSGIPGTTGIVARDMYEQTRRLQATVTNLLDLGRLRHSLVDRHVDLCDVGDLIATAIRLVGHDAEGAAIDVHVDAELPQVMVDRALAEHSLANIVQNALQHGAAPITISTSLSEATVSVLIADSGPGIDTERIAADLFRPFHPFGARSRVGLGLWLARELMRAMGGDIRLTAARPACFQIDLSCAPLGAN